MLRRDMFKLGLAGLALPVLSQTAVAQAVPEGTGGLITPKSSSYAPTNGIEVHYSIYGEGEPLILLHGGLGLTEMFGPVLNELAKDRQVIGIDLQGHGRTLPFERPITYEALADDVAGVIEFLDLSKPDIIGYSLGGGTALRTAIQHPNLVGKLILVSTPFAWSGWHDANQIGMRSISAKQAPALMESPMYQSYAAVAPEPNNFPILLEKLGEWANRDYDWTDELSAVTQPTMLVVGDWDSVRISHSARFFELLGGSAQDANWDGSGINANRFAVLPGQTHYSIFTSPELAQVAAAFLGN